MSSDLELQLDELRQELESLNQNSDAQAIQDLETRAQELLTKTSGSPLNDDALALFKEVSALRRQAAAAALPPPSVDAERLLTGARVRIRTAGTPIDLRDALGQLRQVLDAEPENAEAYNLLEELVEKNDAFKEDVEELLIPLEHRAYRAAETLSRMRQSASSGASGSAGSSDSLEIEELIGRLTNQYYLGEYRKAIDLCPKILLLDSTNTIAKEYLLKSETRLEEGHVPDARIPPRARMAYNKGLSAKRAGMYKEAQDLFNEALQIVEGEGIDRWGDIENALIDIEDLVLTKKLEDDADDLAKQDRWEEALPKYEGALALKDFPRTRKKYEALNKTIKTYRQIGVRLSTFSGSLTSIAGQLRELRNELSEAREYWLESSKLGELWAKVDARSRDIGARLQERGQNLLLQANDARTIDERLRFTDEAVRHLETARDLLPEDAQTDTLLLQAITEDEQAQNIKQLLGDTERLLNQRDAFGIDEALAKLQTIADGASDYIQDPRYRSLLAKLQRYLLEQVEEELDSRTPNLEYARIRLERLRGRLFRPLGRVPEIGALEERIRDVEENLVLARSLELEDAVDNLARQDRWEEAILYEDALELKDFPRTRKKYKALNNVRHIGVKLSTLSGPLTSIAGKLQELRNELSEARMYWPESSRLGELWAEADAHSLNIGARMQERGQDLLLQANDARTIDERLRFTNEALRHLETARDLLPEDPQTGKLLLQAVTEGEHIQKAKALIVEAENLLHQYDEFELRNEEGIHKARAVLELLPHFVIYLEYQRLLVTLVGQLLGRSVYARDHNDLTKAEEYLVQAESLSNFIFCINSVSTIVESVEQQHYKAVESLRERLEQQLKEQKRQFKFKYALSLAESRQYDDAIIVLEELSIKDPQNQTYQLRIKQAKESQERYNKLQSSKRKGRAHLENSDWEKAVQELGVALEQGVALELNPTDPEMQELQESYAEAVELRQRYTKGWIALTTRQKVDLVARASAFMLFLVVTVFLIAANVLR